MTREYQNYLNSPQWNEKRNKRLQIDGCKCAICGNAGQHLNVHHITYRNIMHEDVENDLITLCRPCHAMLHRIRECSATEYENYKKSEPQFKEARKDAAEKKISELATVEIWQRDFSVGGDCKIFDAGAGMIGKLSNVLGMIYPELKPNGLDIKNTLRLARAMKICELYRADESMSQIAERLGMKPSNVYKVLKRHGFNQTARIK